MTDRELLRECRSALVYLHNCNPQEKLIRRIDAAINAGSQENYGNVLTGSSENSAPHRLATTAEALEVLLSRHYDRLSIAERSELQRACKDAARYRFLRASGYMDSPHVYGPDDDCIIDGDDLDAVIDAAINAGAIDSTVMDKGSVQYGNGLSAPAPNASPPPATATFTSEPSQEDLRQCDVVRLAPHLVRRKLTEKGYALAPNAALDAPTPDVFRWHRCHNKNELEAFYLSRLPAIREAARKCGYAIGVHGSMRRDLDLIAAPWIAEHSDLDTLAKAIEVAACGLDSDSYVWGAGNKPCGRVGTVFAVCWTGEMKNVDGTRNNEKSLGCIDLAVMPDTSDLERDRNRLQSLIDAAGAELPVASTGLLDALSENNQRQIDEDGTECGVSRQAVCEIVEYVVTLREAAALAIAKLTARAEAAEHDLSNLYDSLNGEGKARIEAEARIAILEEELVKERARAEAAEEAAAYSTEGNVIATKRAEAAENALRVALANTDEALKCAEIAVEELKQYKQDNSIFGAGA